MASTHNESTTFLEDLRALVQEQAQQAGTGNLAPPSVHTGFGGAADLEKLPSVEPKFPRESLLWMALPPCWTPELTRACNFPSPVSVEIFLETLYEEGLVEKNDLLARRKEMPQLTNYEMTAAARSNVLINYQDPEGRRELEFTLAHIGREIEAASKQLKDVLLPVSRWAVLATKAQDAEAMAAHFDQITSTLFNQRDEAALKNWIDTGHQLAAFYQHDLETPMRFALQKASRRLELFYRLEVDEQHLKGFFERKDQTEAFRQFMSGPPEAWALHFVGAGGVGKTMLMRHITTRLASEMSVVTARIDFDYFNADYPRLAPGMLLWSFGQELRLFDERNVASGYLDDGNNLLRELHKRLQAERSVGGQHATDHPMFRKALGWYIDAFRALSRQINRRILLIVDTCEELARSRPDGSVPENVAETFRILRALHDGPHILDDENLPPDPQRGLPDLKVIFSGRRLLAESGRDWRYESGGATPGREPVRRPFLGLFEMRGFTHDEARRFLHADKTVPPRLIEPVISRSSPDAGGMRGLVWKDPALKPPEEQRCNPYELIYYRDWAREIPPPKPDTILRASSAQYVELRIIRRLRDRTLENLLPAIALLGRFNRETLEAISLLEPKNFEAVFNNLQKQEWIHLRTEAMSDGKDSRLVIVVEPNIRYRLLEYFYPHGALNEAQSRAADYLEAATLNEDLGQLDWSTFDAAMRVLELDPHPERATRWWEQIVERVLRERDWLWLRDLISYLKAEDGAAAPHRSDPHREVRAPSPPAATIGAASPTRPKGPPACRLRPAVLAAYAATLINLPDANRTELYDVWRQVLDQLGTTPASDKFTQRLQLRALAGVISATRYVGIPLTPERVESFWRAVKPLLEAPDEVDEQICVSLLAAIETIVEYAETLTDHVDIWLLFPVGENINKGRPRLRVERDLLPLLFDQYRKSSGDEAHFRELKAFAHTLSGRIHVLQKMKELVKHPFDSALEELEKAPTTSQRRAANWFDWQLPDDLPARVRLECVRALYPHSYSPAELLQRAQSWPTDQETIDGERLAAALLKLQLAQRPVALEELSERGWIIQATGAINFERVNLNTSAEVCNAHRLLPPLFTVVVEALAANGQADEALKQLGEIITQVRQHGPARARHAERAHASIARRMRFNDEESREYGLLAASPLISDRALVWSLDAMNGRKNQKPIPSPPSDAKNSRPWLHAIWQTLYLPEESREKRAQLIFEKLRAAHDPVTFLKNIKQLASLPDLEGLSISEQVTTERTEIELLQTLNFEQLSLHFDVVEGLSLVDERPVKKQSVRELAPPSEGFVKLIKQIEQLEDRLTIWLRYCALSGAGTPPPFVVDKLIEKIGMRRAAEIALREGELLALRLPDIYSTEILFQQAVDWFLKCGDNVGVVIAGLSLVMARGPEASQDKTAQVLGKIEDAYQRLKTQTSLREVLPIWGDLQSEAVLNTGLELKHLSRAQSWRPLLMRLLLSLAHQQGGAQTRHTRMAHLLRTMARPYATEQAGTFGWPADLERWAVEKEKSPDSSERWLIAIGLLVFAMVLAGGFFLFQWLVGLLPKWLIDVKGVSLFRRIGLYVVVLPLVGLLLWRLYKEGRTTLLEISTKETPPVSLLSGWKSTVVSFVVLALSLSLWLGDLLPFKLMSLSAERYPKQILIILLLVAGIALPAVVLLFRGFRTLSRLFRNLSDEMRARALQSFSMTMSITHSSAGTPGEKTPPSNDETQPVQIGQTLQLPRFLTSLPYPFSFKPRAWPTESTIVSPLAAYQEMSKPIPAEHLKDYEKLRKMLRGRSFAVEIDVADGLHGPGWEAMLVYALRREGESLRELPFRLRRSSRTRKSRETRRLKTTTVASWVGNPTANGIASSASKALEGDSRFAVMILQSKHDMLNKWSLKLENIAEQMVKLAKKEEWAETYRMDDTLQVLHLVGTAEDTNGGVRFRLNREEKSSSSKQSLAEESLDRIIDAEEVTARFTNLSLCIIQGDPQKASFTERGAADRQRAILARIFAAKLFAAGVPAVLVIPPLKATLAAAALERVTAMLRRSPRRGTKALLETVGEIAELISVKPELSDEVAWEQALDLCLYAVSDWDGRLVV